MKRFALILIISALLAFVSGCGAELTLQDSEENSYLVTKAEAPYEIYVNERVFTLRKKASLLPKDEKITGFITGYGKRSDTPVNDTSSFLRAGEIGFPYILKGKTLMIYFNGEWWVAR